MTGFANFHCTYNLFVFRVIYLCLLICIIINNNEDDYDLVCSNFFIVKLFCLCCL